MSYKKIYDLVKYPYGKVRRYTAFCLTPHNPGEAKIGGKIIKFENAGKASPDAYHFLNAKSCKEFADRIGIEIRGFDAEPLPGTSIYHQRGENVR